MYCTCNAKIDTWTDDIQVQPTILDWASSVINMVFAIPHVHNACIDIIVFLCFQNASHFYSVIPFQVYGSSSGSKITLTLCIEDHKFSPQNFWNGRWRSEWIASFSPNGGDGEIKGTVRSQVLQVLLIIVQLIELGRNLPLSIVLRFQILIAVLTTIN